MCVEEVKQVLLQWLWFGMMGLSLLWACVWGEGGGMLASALEGCANAVELTIRLASGYMLFGGLMEIAKASGVSALMEKMMKPLLRLCMPNLGRASEAVAMNLSMNVLGLGNAATPKGIEAMKRMEEERRERPMIVHDMYMLLIINATSIQLLPTTVVALRAAAGSSDPGAVILPTLLCTAVSTVTGVFFGCLMRRRRRHDG